MGDILHYLKSHRSSRDQWCRWVVLSEGLLWWWDHPRKASHVVKNKRLWYGGRFGNFGRICPFIGVENSDNGWWWWTGWRGSSYLTDSLTQQLCQPLILENQDPTMSLLCFSFHLEPPLWLMSHDTILWYSLWVSNDVRVLRDISSFLESLLVFICYERMVSSLSVGLTSYERMVSLNTTALWDKSYLWIWHSCA